MWFPAWAAIVSSSFASAAAVTVVRLRLQSLHTSGEMSVTLQMQGCLALGAFTVSTTLSRKTRSSSGRLKGPHSGESLAAGQGASGKQSDIKQRSYASAPNRSAIHVKPNAVRALTNATNLSLPAWSKAHRGEANDAMVSVTGLCSNRAFPIR